ncbi:MAG: hypothetical protein DHS20C15_29470 [Planctomycetota bacterium]|nr:MAG: hypothetical protein DHS20C15_29470 [Planctomycetota bacterium]
MGRWGKLLIVTGFAAVGCMLWWLSADASRDAGAPTRVVAGSDAPSRATPAVPLASSEATALDTSAALPPAEAAAADSADPAADWPEGLVSMSAHGRVIDSTGAPVADAVVLLLPDLKTGCKLGMCSGYPPTTLDPELCSTTRTNDRGEFRLEGPWLPDNGVRVSHQAPFPTLVVAAPGQAIQHFRCEGFAGGEHAAGDLVLDQLGSELRARLVDPSGQPHVGMRASFVHIDWKPFYEMRSRTVPMNGGLMFPALSDANGELRIPNLWPTTHELWLELEAGRWEAIDEFALTPGVVDLGELLVDPHAGPSISGLVRDANGAPLEGASVYAQGYHSYNPRLPDPPGADPAAAYLRRAEERGVLTDAEGRYVLRQLESNWVQHEVAISASGHEPALLRDVPFDSEAPAVKLAPQGVLDVQVRAATDGRVLPDAVLQAFRPTGLWRKRTGNTSIPLAVELRVEAARVLQAGALGTRLYVAAHGFAAKSIEAPGVAPGETRAVIVELEPAATLTVRVLDDRGEPVPGVSVSLDPPLAWGTGAQYGDLGSELQAMTDEHGRSTHTGLAAGAWTLNASSPEHFGVRDVPCELSGSNAEIELRLKRRAAVVGQLLSVTGEPVSGANVYVTSQVSSGGFDTNSVVTDLEGRFAYRLLREGEFRLQAARVPLERLGITPGQEVDVTLQQLPAFVLEGRVTSGGAPVSEAQVMTHGPVIEGEQGDGGWSNHARTDANGDYSMEVGAFGLLNVTVDAPGGARSVAQLESRPGERARHDVELGSAALGGVVHFPDIELDVRYQRITLMQDNSRVAFESLPLDGRFLFEPLSAGSYSIQVDVPGARTLKAGPFELGAGERRVDLELTLELACSVRVALRWQSGEAFNGLAFLKRLDAEAPLRLAQVQDGHVVLGGLAPGRWELDFQIGGFGSDDFPGLDAPRLPLRESFTLTLGDELELDLVMPGAPPP